MAERLRFVARLLEPRPPVEERAVADQVVLLHEGDAALAYDLVEVLDRLEVAIDERLVDEGIGSDDGRPPRAATRWEPKPAGDRLQAVESKARFQHDAMTRPIAKPARATSL